MLEKNITRCRLITLPKITDSRGTISFMESMKEIPFDIRRLYYSYDVPDDESIRGEHGHKALQQVIIAMSGSFTVTLDDGFSQQSFNLNRPWRGLYVAPKMWRSVYNFSSGAVCLVLASEGYDPDDYIRDYAAFRQYARDELNA